VLGVRGHRFCGQGLEVTDERLQDVSGGVQELVKKVESFQKDVQVALGVEEPDVETLDKLTEAGAELDIDVPEVNKLKHVSVFVLVYAKIRMRYL
jgi:hypothetical protein